MDSSTPTPLSTAAATNNKLPPFFPLTCTKCKDVTDVFFQCFEANAAMKHPTDTESGLAAIGICQKEMKDYSVCMEDYLAKKAASTTGDKKKKYLFF